MLKYLERESRWEEEAVEEVVERRRMEMSAIWRCVMFVYLIFRCALKRGRMTYGGNDDDAGKADCPARRSHDN